MNKWFFYWFDNLKMQRKIVLGVSIVTLVSVVSLEAYSYFRLKDISYQLAGERLSTQAQQALAVSVEVVHGHIDTLKTLALSPSIIDAVTIANTSYNDRSRAEIESQIAILDQAWKNEESSVDDLVAVISNNQVSQLLLAFQDEFPQEIEVFITDIQGLNIAMTNRTGDYFQADEAWWQGAYQDGSGSVFLGAVDYDDSTGAWAIDVGVPIRSSDGTQVIGVLRGTIDISVVFETFSSVTFGDTGYAVLIDKEGKVLFANNPNWLMQIAPEEFISQIGDQRHAWQQGVDLEGNPALLATDSLDGVIGDGLGWTIFLDQDISEIYHTVLSTIFSSLIIAGVVISMMIFGSILFGRSISEPLELVTEGALRLSQGDTALRGMNREKTSQVDLRRDEIGAIGRAFTALIKYFEEMTAVSQHIAAGDLSVEVQPKSDQDMLGNALSRMVVNLRNLLSHVTENASSLGSASNQLAAASEQAGQAAEQITMKIQHVALGVAQQSNSVSETASSVDQMVRAIEGVAKGAQEQASAVTKSSEVTTQMASAIQQVAANAQAGARGASEAANTAEYGARIVDKNLESMETIKDRVSLAAHKVKEMGKHSDQIGMIVKTIDDIASQINLLALNAAIEAARVEGKGEQIVEQLLQRHLLGVLNLVAEMFAKNPDLNSVDLAGLALQSQVESLSISDADGVIILSNDPENLGFRYSEDPEHESSASRPLLNQDDGVVIRPIEPRDSDGKPYLYVAISRRDCPGILSAGVPGEIAYLLGNFSRGFAVVADEVRKLAERTASATKQTAQLIKEVLDSVSEAVDAMDESAAEVDHGVIQAKEAGKALHSILTAVDDVNRQVDEISVAAEQMTTSSNELVVAMDSVSAIVEENTAATEEMSAGSNEVNQSIENIASISEENSAAIEEISASTEEMNAQVEEVSASAASLADMSQQLTSLTSQFYLGAKLNINQENELSRQSSTAETISGPSATVDIAANGLSARSIGSNGR